MSGDGRLVRALVACYPAAWRRRYGDEYAQLLVDLRVHRRLSLIIDSLRGAARAYGGVLMTAGSPMTVVVWAAGLFTVAGTGFAKLAEDFTAVGRIAYAVAVVATAAAFLAMLRAAAPTAAAILRTRDVVAGKYLTVPIAGAAVWYGVLRLAMAISAGHSIHSAPTIAGFMMIAVTGAAVVAASAWAAAAILRRRAPAPAGPQFTAVAVSMAVATVAALVWGLQVHLRDPAGFRGDHGFLATPFLPSWIAVVMALSAATVLAASAGRRRRA